MFDAIQAKCDEYRRELDETEPLTAQRDNDNNPNMCFILYLVIYYALSISLIAYGAIHINDCPAEKMLPISLIVIGSLIILLCVIRCPYDIQKIFLARSSDTQPNWIVMGIMTLILLVTVGWLFAMYYWIFNLQPDTIPEHREAANYCQSEFYRNMYWGSVFGLAVFGLLFIGLCGCICCLVCGMSGE